MKDLQHKVTVITGAAGGLGRALALACYRLGSHLALIDTDAAGLDALLPVFSNKEQKVSLHTADISEEEAVIQAKDAIIALHGRVDMLVNNAAVSISRPFGQVAMADFQHLFRVNFWGTVYCCRHFLPVLQQGKDSRLVNIVSGFALMGFPGKTAYASSKAAVTGFTHCLKTELAGTPVKVCLVIPPPLATHLVQSGIHIDEEKKEREAAFVAKNGLPLKQTAATIVRKVLRGEYRIVTGRMMFCSDVAARLFPTALLRFIARSSKKYDFL